MAGESSVDLKGTWRLHVIAVVVSLGVALGASLLLLTLTNLASSIAVVLGGVLMVVFLVPIEAVVAKRLRGASREERNRWFDLDVAFSLTYMRVLGSVLIGSLIVGATTILLVEAH